MAWKVFACFCETAAATESDWISIEDERRLWAPLDSLNVCPVLVLLPDREQEPGGLWWTISMQIPWAGGPWKGHYHSTMGNMMNQIESQNFGVSMGILFWDKPDQTPLESLSYILSWCDLSFFPCLKGPSSRTRCKNTQVGSSWYEPVSPLESWEFPQAYPTKNFVRMFSHTPQPTYHHFHIFSHIFTLKLPWIVDAALSLRQTQLMSIPAPW